MKETKLVIKGDEAYLKVVFEKEREEIIPKESVAVDIIWMTL